MIAPLDLSLVCPVVVGRAAQVAALHGLVGEVRHGRGAAVLLVGEAGVGKTRLAAEARSYALAHGFRVVRGNCFEPDTACPYAPLLDLLRAHFTDQADLGPGTGALHALLPDLIPPPPDAPPPLDAEQERRRIFAALAQVFLHLAARQPLLVVIEDLHWSDDASLEVLHLLMRRAADRPLLLLMTYRGDEAGTNLRHWLAQLNRQHLAREMSLAPLALAEVEVMLHEIFAPQQPVGRDFLDAIYGLSQGNPFIVEELLKSLVATGEVAYSGGTWTRKPIARLHIPRSVQDAVQQRCARLSEPARHLANLAAVSGRRFDIAILQAVSGYDDATLLALLKELIAAQLVVEESADRFIFRHALTREAIYTSLLAREGQLLHQAIAEVIERRAAEMPDPFLADLAYHYHAAGSWEQAAEYARRAAERAQGLNAPKVVIEQASRALEAAAHLRQVPDPRLHRMRGEAHDLLGDFAGAQADYEAVLHRARAAGDRAAEWRGLLDLGFLWTGRDYAVASAHLTDALDLARTLGDPVALAHSLNRVGNWYANAEQPEMALAHHREALAIFEQRNDRPGLAATLDLLGMAAALGGDLVAGNRHGARALAIFRELGDRRGEFGGLISFAAPAIYEASIYVGKRASLTEAIEACAQALALAREIDWRSGEVFADAMRGEALAAHGDYAQALAALRGALSLAEEIEHLQWTIQVHCGLTGLHADLLALPTAREHCERALALAHEIRSPLWIRIFAGILASLLVAQGALAEAEATLAREIDPAMPMQTQGERQLWCASAEFALARDNPAEALAILNRLYATAANLRDEGDIPRLARLKGAALAALGELESAERLLRAGLATAEAQGLATRWQLHVALGNLQRQRNRPDDAAREHATARRLIEEHAAALPAGDLRDGFARGALALLAPLAARRAAREAHGGLTAREREVAALIARGGSNREIADRLSVSERTVETHVSNILPKLGFATRAQIAAWAAERGLASPGS